MEDSEISQKRQKVNFLSLHNKANKHFHEEYRKSVFSIICTTSEGHNKPVAYKRSLHTPSKTMHFNLKY